MNRLPGKQPQDLIPAQLPPSVTSSNIRQSLLSSPEMRADAMHKAAGRIEVSTVLWKKKFQPAKSWAQPRLPSPKTVVFSGTSFRLRVRSACKHTKTQLCKQQLRQENGLSQFFPHHQSWTKASTKFWMISTCLFSLTPLPRMLAFRRHLKSLCVSYLFSDIFSASFGEHPQSAGCPELQETLLLVLKWSQQERAGLCLPPLPSLGHGDICAHYSSAPRGLQEELDGIASKRAWEAFLTFHSHTSNE